MMKLSQKQKNPRKKVKFLSTVSAAMFTLSLSMVSGFAAAPSGVQTTEYNSLVEIVFWVASIAIAAAVGIPSLIKIGQGQADEDPRGRNAGIAGLVVTGALIGAAVAIKTLLF